MNLIICMTPLQVLIAEKILEERKDEQFQLIFISERDSEKDRFYFNRLSKKVDVMTLAKISEHKDISILQNVYYAPDMDFLMREEQ